MNTMSTFSIGQQVRFGRSQGEQSLGTVVSKGRTKLKVRLDQARGTRKAHKVGGIWTVPPSLCTATNGTAAPTAPTKAKRTDAEILREIEGVYSGLSPENLTCDGEASASHVRKMGARLRRQLRALEAEIGRKVSEGESYGRLTSIDPFAPTKTTPHKVMSWDVPIVTFAKGDKVAFNDRKGNEIIGFVKRVNRKTISVNPIGQTGGRYWRVGASMLRKVA